MTGDTRRDLLNIFEAGVARVQGEEAVRAALVNSPCTGPVDLLAVGKAADAMAGGAIACCDSQIVRGLVITKRDHFSTSFDDRFQCLEADHPVPTDASLAAGDAMVTFLQSVPSDRDVLILLSGGASSLVEKLKSGLSLDDLKRVNRTLLSVGFDIAAMNAIRSQLSELKGGQAARFVNSEDARVMLISDVPGDDPAVIGSGPFYASTKRASTSWPESIQDIRARLSVDERGSTALPQIPHSVVANPSLAASAATQTGKSRGYPMVYNERLLADSVEAVAEQVFLALDQADDGCYVWNAEPTVTLPANPGRGGRNQHLALLLAKKIAGRSDLTILVAGTDGTDGPTDDAGALVDGATIARGEGDGFRVDQVLDRFDAGGFLESSGDLITTGPTGTNVMDLIIAIKASH